MLGVADKVGQLEKKWWLREKDYQKLNPRTEQFSSDGSENYNKMGTFRYPLCAFQFSLASLCCYLWVDIMYLTWSLFKRLEGKRFSVFMQFPNLKFLHHWICRHTKHKIFKKIYWNVKLSKCRKVLANYYKANM